MKYFTMDNHSIILFSLSILKVKLTKITVVPWKCKKMSVYQLTLDAGDPVSICKQLPEGWLISQEKTEVLMAYFDQRS